MLSGNSRLSWFVSNTVSTSAGRSLHSNSPRVACAMRLSRRCRDAAKYSVRNVFKAVFPSSIMSCLLPVACTTVDAAASFAMRPLIFSKLARSAPRSMPATSDDRRIMVRRAICTMSPSVGSSSWLKTLSMSCGMSCCSHCRKVSRRKSRFSKRRRAR